MSGFYGQPIAATPGLQAALDAKADAAATSAALDLKAALSSLAPLGIRIMLGLNADVADTGLDYSGFAPINWDEAAYNIGGGFTWTIGSPSKIIIGAALDGKYVQFGAALELNSVTASTPVQIILLKGGSDNWRRASQSFASPAADLQPNMAVTTGPVLVATGEEYEVYLKTASDASIDLVTARCNFWAQGYAAPAA